MDRNKLITVVMICAVSASLWGQQGGGGGVKKVVGGTSISVSPSSGVGVVTVNSTLTNVTNDAQTKASVVPNTAPSAGQIPVGNAGGTAYAPVAMSGDATLASTGAITVKHVITFIIDNNGSAITTGALKDFVTANFSCTITKAQISSDVSGSITVDIWKANGSIPTAANKISASAPITLSSAQLNQNSALTAWTTSVAVGDVFGFSVASSATVTHVVGQIWCQ